MELFQLKYFVAVVREGSISEAARSCHVSQPSLSNQIGLLENEMGTKLLNRSPRGTSPTPAGLRLYRSAVLVERELREAQGDIQNEDFETESHVRLGVQPMIAASLLFQPLKEIFKSHPQTKIAITERPSVILPDLVKQQEVDACLMTEGLPVSSELTVMPLLTMRYVAFVPRGHALAGRSQLSFAQLLSHRLILFNDPLDLGSRIQRLAISSGKNVRIVFSSDQALTVLQMAANGLGIAILPEVLQEIGAKQSLKAIPLKEPGLKSRIAAAWLKDTPLSPVLRNLFESLRD